MDRNGKLCKVGIVGCRHTTQDVLIGLARHGYLIDHCITISPEEAERQGVIGYVELGSLLRDLGIAQTVVDSYSLRATGDRERVLEVDLDLLLVVGWGRLLPDWWLNSLPLDAYGVHGAGKPLPFGRGRSPVNWSIVQGMQMFFTQLFRLEVGIDDGPIVDVYPFDILPYDDFLTIHLKNTEARLKLYLRNLPAMLDGTPQLWSQPDTPPSYYQKRTEEDDTIDWTDCTNTIYNLVRGVTRPFTGAFTFLDANPDHRLIVWRAIPFDSHFEWPGSQPGEIVEVFFNGSAVVRTGDTSLLIQESEGYKLGPDDIGRRLKHYKNRSIEEERKTSGPLTT